MIFFFFNSSIGYIVGDQIIRTTNAGLNWIVQNGFYHLNSVFFVSPLIGFVAGEDNKVFKTVNGGINWTLITPQIYSYWYSVHFRDSSNGMLLGANGRIIKTIDGGKNWTQIFNQNNETYVTHFQQDNFLYVGGGHGSLLKTSNYGSNWQLTPSGQNNLTISSIYAANNNSINTLISGRAVGSNFDISLTSNSGINWTSKVEGPRQYQFNSVAFFNSNTGIIAGGVFSELNNGIILRTTNNGNNWLSIATYNYNLNDISLFLNGTAYISGSGSKILKTTDYGATWVISTVGYGFNYTSISFLDLNTGLTGGFGNDYYQAIKTTNGGQNWSVVFNPSNSGAPRSVQIVDFNTYYVGGTIVYKTTNGGLNWSSLNLPTNHKYGLHFFNKDTGLVGGVGPTFRTTNGGINWITVYSHDGASINNFEFINSNTGYGVGYSYSDTRMIKTTNGGISWVNFQGITANEFKSMEMIDEDTIYIVGGAGLIIKTTNGGGSIIGVSELSTGIPAKHSLTQNYPNPFNPVTKIKFDIPNKLNVKISVFDILGKEISILVNEELNPGTFEIDWDASNFPSGVYFYRFETDAYSETKKMVLVK